MKAVVGSAGTYNFQDLCRFQRYLDRQLANSSDLRKQQMDEKALLELWNIKRSQVIHAQLAPSIVLIGILALAAFGKFDMASSNVQYLAIGIVLASGILSIIAQFAAIREAEAVVRELKTIQNPTLLGKKVSQSGMLLSLTTFATVGLGLLTYVLVISAVLN